MTPRKVSVLGSTGSIGASTLGLVAENPDRFEVVALAAGGNAHLLAEQVRRFRPSFAAVSDEGAYCALRDAVGPGATELAAGADAVVEAARRGSDWVMSAITGAAGLAPTLAALERGATVALANKESLVCAGQLIMAAVREHAGAVLPVDSEHNAIFQVFETERRDRIERLILTASGGPFLRACRATMAEATPAAALDHPNWNMGRKVSVDSATMMNKGLELIEAHHLFAMPADAIDIVVHPQSVVHSLVAYDDGSVLAQLGTPDMRTPIAVALAWPGRMAVAGRRLDLTAVARLEFEAPDTERFPALVLAREALAAGGGRPTALNAANEVSVAAFLDGRIGFLNIADIAGETMALMRGRELRNLADVWATDAEAREIAAGLARRAKGGP